MGRAGWARARDRVRFGVGLGFRVGEGLRVRVMVGGRVSV